MELKISLKFGLKYMVDKSCLVSGLVRDVVGSLDGVVVPVRT